MKNSLSLFRVPFFAPVKIFQCRAQLGFEQTLSCLTSLIVWIAISESNQAFVFVHRGCVCPTGRSHADGWQLSLDQNPVMLNSTR